MKKDLSKINLHWLQFESDININTKGVAQVDYSIVSGVVSVYFKNLEERLVRHIEQAEVVMGCVAWLTSPTIISVLAKKQVAIVVQKEDFLRPDLDVSKYWARKLRAFYNKIS